MSPMTVGSGEEQDPGTAAAQAGGSYFPGSSGTPPDQQPQIVHSKWGNLLRFLNNPIRDAMVGAESVRPTVGAGNSSLTSFAQGFGGANQAQIQRQLMAQQLAFRQAEEQRLQAQAEEQHARALREESQANKPQPPKLYEFGDSQYLWNPDKGAFEPALDANGKVIPGANKTTKSKVPKPLTGKLEGYQQDEDSGAVTPMLANMPDVGPGIPSNSPVGQVPGINEPGPETPGLSLPSVVQAADQAKEDAANKKDTKPHWESKFNQAAPGGPKRMVMVDTNADSPTFGKTRPVPGVTEYERPEAPDRAADRMDRMQQDQEDAETAAEKFLHAYGGDPDKAVEAVGRSNATPARLKQKIRAIIRDTQKYNKPVPKGDATDLLIKQMLEGTGAPAPPGQ